MRKSVFDGSFYFRNKHKLSEFIDDAINEAKVPNAAKEAHAYVAPHAGYIYSGRTAAFTYKALKENSRAQDANTTVVIGPNHTGMGRPISVSKEDWETPLGKVANDKEFSVELAENSDYVQLDESAHEGEHSIEVQLPFLQTILPNKKFAFVCMGDQSIEASEILFQSILKTSESLERRIMVIASSDFDHYESAKVAKMKDAPLLEAIKALDYKRFSRLVHELDDSACGFGPITVAMMFARHIGAKSGVVMKYNNSGDETNDYSSVVAYASIALV